MGNGTLHRGNGLVAKEVVGGESIGLVELPRRTVKVVGSALGDLIQSSAGGMAKGSVGVRDLDAYLLDRVLRRAVGQATVPGGVGGTVEKRLAGLSVSATDAPARRALRIEGMDQARLTIANHAER